MTLLSAGDASSLALLCDLSFCSFNFLRRALDCSCLRLDAFPCNSSENMIVLISDVIRIVQSIESTLF